MKIRLLNKPETEEECNSIKACNNCVYWYSPDCPDFNDPDEVV